MWNRDTHKMLSNHTKRTLADIVLGIHHKSTTKDIPDFNPDMLEESFTHFYLQRPTTNTAKFLFQNKDKSIQNIVLECADYHSFDMLIRTDAKAYDVVDGQNMHANVNFFDDPVVPLPVAAPATAAPATAAPAAAAAAPEVD